MMGQKGSNRHSKAEGIRPILACGLATALAAAVLAEAPPLPSSRYGEVSIAGAPAAPGTTVSAHFAGAVRAAAACQERAGQCAYRLDVPGDRQETPEVEGPGPGESFELRVGGALAGTSSWVAGVYEPLDLEVPAGSDLSVSIDDGLAAVATGTTVAFEVSVRNDGPGIAHGVALRGQRPPESIWIAASDGGILAGESVDWPSFDLPPGASVERSFTVRIDTTVPAGLESISAGVTAAHDGSGGGDPDPSDDTAVDQDALVAAPDLGVEVSDGLSAARPGETLVYRIRVANAGTQGATGVAPVMRLPTGVGFFSASHGGQVVGDEIRWAGVDLGTARSLERSVTGRVFAALDPSVVELRGEAEALDDAGNGADLDPTDNRSSDVDSVHHAVDLTVVEIERSEVAVDPRSLVVSGSLHVALRNQGTLPAGPFEAVAFEDLDFDSAYSPAVDRYLGGLPMEGLPAGSTRGQTLPVSGELLFRDNRIFVKVDALDEVSELDEGNNQLDSGARCLATPPPGAFSAVLERNWPGDDPSLFAPGSTDSISTPIVVQLTDDNGDGRRDARDVPDIAFVTANSYYQLEPQIYLRAIHGDTGAEIFHVNGFLPGPVVSAAFSFSGLAAGDIDGDGDVELVTTTFGPTPGNATLVALEHNGAWKWRSAVYRTHPDPNGLTNRDNPTIADLDGDGNVEILVGANVFDARGRLLWRGTGGQAFQSAGNSSDRGGAISVAADVDLDGRLEVVTGNTLYRHDGTILWQSPLPDGYPAVANFDADPRPEIVVVSQGTVRLHDDDGSLLWGPVELPGTDPEAGGAPTIADFDGDGQPEIGVAGSDVFVAFRADGTILWQASTQDYTSNQTGSTAFDLDGDGVVEVIYRDERKLRIFRGSDGVVLFEDTLSSNTWTEEPVIADVDRDGNAEIVVSTDRAPDVPVPPGGRTAGLRIYGSANDGWTWARPAWNQHAFTPDQIEDDGGIPPRPAWGWLTHNTFRVNHAPVDAAHAGPDLTAGRLIVDFSSPPMLHLSVRVGNGGRTPVAPGLRVAFYAGAPGGALLAVREIDSRLEPGTFVDLAFTLDAIAGLSSGIVAVADDDGTGRGREMECEEANNTVSASFDPTLLGLWLTLDDGLAAVSPGDVVTYLLTVRNAYLHPVTGVALRDLLPAGTSLVDASDGGVLIDGAVRWPLFGLPARGQATRSLTLRIDPDLPVSVTEIANQAEVTDDAPAGTDPTPENNLAFDLDLVASVVARAGGPYAASEGASLLVDGSTSYDRDGLIVAYDWDLDGDGEFDDADVAIATVRFRDEGIHVVRLRVRDDAGGEDVDLATVDVSNEPPAVVAPSALASVEGQVLALSGASVSDPGLDDTLTATVSWGDGGPAEPAGISSGELVAQHLFRDEGTFAVDICVNDGDGGQGCAVSSAAVENAAPVIDAWQGFDFGDWQSEELGGGSTALWSIAGDGRAATEQRNGEPSVLLGNLPAFGTHEIVMRVDDGWDDDFVGLVLGYEPGDLADPGASYLLLDWKREDQDGARRGFAVSRVSGRPLVGELWLHADVLANGVGEGVVELARGATRGSTGWSPHTEYRVRVEFGPTRLRVWVDGVREVDLAGSFGGGRLGLYDFSQAQATFVAVTSALSLNGFEGAPIALCARFADLGVLDRHTARVEWGDGETAAPSVSEEGGRGEVLVEHLYADDGRPLVTLCIADEDSGEDCEVVPAFVENQAPVLSLEVAATGFLEDPVTLAGSSFADPGSLDLHTATVSWGDGSEEPALVNEAGGLGTLAATHGYASTGEYPVRVCVADDDGAASCQGRSIRLVPRALDLALDKTVTPAIARPGQRVTFTLTVRNTGTLPATGIELRDPLPPHLAFVSATGGAVVAGGTVTWTLGSLAPGASLTVAVSSDVSPSAPHGATVVNTATVQDDGASGADENPLDNVAAAALRFSDAVTPVVLFGQPLAGTEGRTLALVGVTWTDPTGGESHTATIDWGDGWSAPLPGNFVGTGGTFAASHVYADDGAYTVQICMRDTAGHSDCGTGTATVVNVPPSVVEPGAVELRLWQFEEYETPDPPASWIVASDGLSVRQSVNSQPSVFYSPLPAIETTLQGVLRVGTWGEWDDDYVGFVLGFEPGDTTDPEADFLLVDWKQENQVTARRGLVVSRVRGAVTGAELWDHAYDDPVNGTQRVEVLARAATLGDTGWREFRDYAFRFEYTESRLRIWVDEVLQFDLAGSFPAGRFGFYNYSQEDVTYRGFVSGLTHQLEGETFLLVAPFTDPGTSDTFTATIDWGDGETTPAPASASQGFGQVLASHAYLDNHEVEIATCVTDDDGGSDCGRFPLQVLNVSPVVTPAPEAIAVAGQEVTLPLASFTDVGRLDSHLATVGWGDGATGGARVLEDRGEGTVEGTHRWSLPGTYPVGVCVEDDDGGSACAGLSVQVLASPPLLAVTKTVDAIDRDGDGQVTPGDDLVYRIEIVNRGASALSSVTLTDPIPAHTRVVPGSVVPALLASSESPVVVSLPVLTPQASLVVQFAVSIDSPWPAGVREVVNQAMVTTAEAPVVASDDPGLPGLADPTRIAVSAAPALALVKRVQLEDLDANGVATPGDELLWTVETRVGGDTAATGLVLSDPIPAHTALVDGSIATTTGEVIGLTPLLVSLPAIPVGGASTLTFRTRIDPALPPGVEEVVNQAAVFSNEVDAILSDDPTTPQPGDATRIPVYVFPTLSVAAATVAEGNAGTVPLRFLLALDRPTRLAVAVDWMVEGVTASAGEDFLAATGTATIPVGAAETSIEVEVLGDLVVEPSETLRLRLSSPRFVHLAQVEIEGVILDDDQTALAVADAAISEGEGARFLVSLTAPSALPVSVDWATVEGSALAGADFVAASGTLVFPPLLMALEVPVATVEDAVPELDESFRLLLSGPAVATLADGEAVGTIVDDDPTDLSVGDVALDEGDAGTTQVLVPVSLSVAHSVEVRVDWATEAGTALPGEDFVGASGTLRFAPGTTVLEAPVPVLGDETPEPDERFSLRLSAPVHAGLADPVAEVLIRDDDTPECALTCPLDLVVGNAPGLCAAVVDFGSPQTTGECGAVSCLPGTGGGFAVGQTQVVCTSSTTAASCSFSVRVEDREPPVVIAPHLVVANDPGFCEAAVTWSASVTDNCPGVGAVACGVSPGSLLPVGVTAVTCSARDAAGLEGQDRGSVTVEDREPPRIAACPADLAIVQPGWQPPPVVTFVLPPASDNCPGVAVDCQPASGSTFPFGQSPVTCTAEDGAHLRDACDFVVAVEAQSVLEIPTLSGKLLAALAVLLAGLGLRRLARHRLSSSRGSR